MKYQILDNKKLKIIKSDVCNLFFNKENGFTATWGRTKEENPEYSPFGPFIADIELSTICSGVGFVCKFCYKANTPTGENMSLETFKKMFDKLPRTVTQVAMGVGDINGNPDLFPIMEYCREKGVIPNITINGAGLTDEIAQKLVNVCGAVAVSIYDKEYTYNTIKKLTGLGMSQCNIHCMISEETFDLAKSVLSDRLTDERLKNMNAIVFLSLKKQGRAKTGFTQLSQEKFQELVDYALSHNIPFGFDSCGCHKFIKSIGGNINKNQLEMMAEDCESTRFSIYVNVKGDFYPCSFIEGEKTESSDWSRGISVINCNDFLKEIWFDEKTKKFRNAVIECNKCQNNCNHFKI